MAGLWNRFYRHRLVGLTAITVLVGGFVFSAGLGFAASTRGIQVLARSLEGSTQSVDLYDRSVALIVGIDRYENLPSDQQLSYAVKDAKGMEAVLRKNYQFDEIKTLYNQQATRDKIMETLYGFRSLGTDAAVFVYFAGHGITEPGALAGRDLGFLIPYDGYLESSKMYKNISMQQIKSDIAASIPAKHVYFVFDACFAGLMLDTRSTMVEPRRDLAYLQSITGEQVRQVLTAGAKGQTVLDGGPGGHSVFTGRLIQLLEGVEDYITARELGQQLKKQVYADAAARGHEQRPVDGEIYGTGDFVFVPDLAKRSRDLNDEVKRLEAEMARLQRLKEETDKAQDLARQREIEQQELVAQAELKLAQIRREQKEQALARQEQSAHEAEREAQSRQEKEREAALRLARLEDQAAKMREQLGGELTGGATLEAAVSEMQRIQREIDSIEQEFARESAQQTSSLGQFYDLKIERVLRVEPWDEEFETQSDYQQRVTQARGRAEPLQKEKTAKLAAMEKGLATARDAQVKPLAQQLESLSQKRFPVPVSSVSFTFQYYALNTKTMMGEMKLDGKTFVFRVPIPTAQAREYKRRPDLLVPTVRMRASTTGAEVAELVFQGAHPDESYGAEGSLVQFLQDCSGCPELVVVPAGRFVMGSPSSEPERGNDEDPQHEVTIAKPFAVGMYEVTVVQWDACVAAGGCKRRRYRTPASGNLPEIWVEWREAQKYVKWLSGKTGKRYRLLSEAEWEYAARAGTTTAFFFGNQITTDQANFGGNNRTRIVPVGSFPPNAISLYDMHGNVSEWVEDCWHGNYDGAPSDGRAWLTGDCTRRVLRGGSWEDDGSRDLRSANRGEYDSSDTRYSIGFRVARDL